VAPLEFNNGVYRDIPLRFVNISGSNQAIDYAKKDSYLLVATSKETMFTLLDAASGQTVPLNASADWFNLFTSWGALPTAERMTVAHISEPSVLRFLPRNPTSARVGFTINALPDNANQSRLQGIINLGP